MNNNILYISILCTFLCLSCKQAEKPEAIRNPRDIQIEQAVRNSTLLEKSDLSDFKDFEEIVIDYTELPSYKQIQDDIMWAEESITNPETEEDMKEFCRRRIIMNTNRINFLKEKTTPIMYRVKLKEVVKVGGKPAFTTQAQVYLNEMYEVVDFIH
jgi:CRISPR/Cas system CMR subunit Cmr4 (Cas7 group RAMP superfamily)